MKNIIPHSKNPKRRFGFGGRGFSTIEVLIAMMVMVAVFSATALLSFGSQSMLAGGELNAGALSRAQKLLEHQQSLARKDFNLLQNIATTSDGIYRQSVSVGVWQGDPYATKRVTALVSWADQNNTARSLSLDTLVSNIDHAVGGDTCGSVVSGDWVAPHISNYALTLTGILPSPPAGHTFGTSTPITAIDAYKGKVYVALASTSAKVNDSLFVLDSTDPVRGPQYLASVDNNTSSIDGAEALKAAGGYLYVANAHDANFKTCKPSVNCAQVQIFDTSNSSSITSVAYYLLPTSSPPYVYGSGGQAVAKSISYKDGYLFLGLSKTGNGPEFNIIDVHDPHVPVWIGGFAVGAIIKSIYTAHGYAYLATDDVARDLIVLDIHDPSSPSLVATYNAPNPHSESLYMLGDRLFLGLTPAFGAPELRMLDVTDPLAPALAGSQKIGASAVGVVVRDTLMFVLTSTTKQLKIFDISDVSAIATTSILTMPGVGTSLDCEGNTLYVASNDGGQGYVSVIAP